MVTTTFCCPGEGVPAALVSPEHSAERARRLAARHRLTAKPGSSRLLPRLEHDAQSIQAARRLLGRAADRGSGIPLAGTWLLDNYGLIRDEIQTARRQLPRTYGNRLPRLSGGAHRGLPRAYGLARELVANLDGQLDQEHLHQFFSAYQSVTPLTLSELWATANMLRLALIEALGRVALRVVGRGQGVAGPAGGDDQEQAMDERAMRNGIANLRALAVLDWREFVEAQSAVERVLRGDSAGVYGRMDFASRDYCRRMVERIAQRSPLTELEVAQSAVAHARNACRDCTVEYRSPAQPEDARCHVGYYLVAEGRSAFERDIGYRRTWRDILAGLAARTPLGCYLGGTMGVWLLTVAAAAAMGWRLGLGQSARSWSSLIVLALLAGTASQFAVSIVNWLCTLIVPPRPLLRLDFSGGVPAECRTLVAVPAMLSSEEGVRNLVEQLEWRYLTNRDDNLSFALLTDFPDAAQETLPGDRRLLMLARSEIGRLNDRHCRNRPTKFYLLHRPRKWNRQEGVWMAEERKRGKLAALNHLLQTGANEAFSVTVGNLAELFSVRYVLTLDSDTRLPRDVARELAGCMAHPLNRPQIDPRTRRVVKGHAILQPRVGATLRDASRSPFSRLLAGDAGIDPYTRQTSEVYHDVFGQGSYIGKGIYDVHAFAAVLEGRFPDNRVLSHDLIEGCFARSGLVNDVELFEGLPSRFLADMERRHRWIRGDWQIASWLWKRVPATRGKARNPLDALARWKIFDNLRRSLMPPFVLAFLLAGWTLLPHLAGYWTILALLLVCGPPLAGCLPGFLGKPLEKPWSLHVKDQAARFSKALWTETFAWCVLPYAAERNVDAIARTLYRLCVSHRKLLEWIASTEAEAQCPGGCREHYARMWACAVAGAAAMALLAVEDRRALLWAGPMLLAWLAGPLLAWWSSQPDCRRDAAPRKVPEREVRRWARQTWHYFETFANEKEHWLPPDNVQAHSPPGTRQPEEEVFSPGAGSVATRTSPTNIGMGLLSGLAAYDLGYLPATDLIDRTRAVLHTMRRLERCRGHLYNWYDTRTLRPLEPRYVSTVDSGNLWGALTVLAAGLDELRDRLLVPPRFLEGLQDILEVMAGIRAGCWTSAVFDDPLDECLGQLRLQSAGASPTSARRAHELLCRIRALAATLPTTTSGSAPALRPWTEAFLRQSAAVHQEILRWAFWLRMPQCAVLRGSGLKNAVKELHGCLDRLDAGCTLGELPRAAEQVADRIGRLSEVVSQRGSGSDDACRQLLLTLSSVRRAAERAARAAREQLDEIAVLSTHCRQFCGMDFRFLFDSQRKLLSIGFQVSEDRRDESCYDLLASESRLTSFLAVSHGQLPPEHWFALGRTMTLADGKPVLLSWSGSVFEYLMPALLMPSYAGTLLEASCGAAVRRHIRYARRHGVPWGISESCYNRTDENQNYQYRAHGAPGLGLKRGLGEHLVVAPYASALAMMVAPQEASCNLAWLEQRGYLGPHGFYDAIDFTPPCPGAPPEPAPCRTVMAHHSGMTLLALGNVLLGGPMPRRFLKTPACAAYDLLLQERMPQAIRPIPLEMLDDDGSS